MVTRLYIRKMLLFVPTPQKKKRPTSFADELAARIKGEVLLKQDEERSCKLMLDKRLWDSGGLVRELNRAFCVTEISQICYLNMQ